MFVHFGKKKARSTRRSIKTRKPPARLLKLCKKCHVKTTRKVGGKRVYKLSSVLKKACLKYRKTHRKVHRKTHRKVHRRCMGFGLMGSAFETPANYGYNQQVKQAQQSLSQSNSVVNNNLNSSRPDQMQLPSGSNPIYGTNAEFFGQQIPRIIPPEWNFMGQPDGSLYPVGAPFYGYPSPNSAFGKKMLRYRKSNRSACSRLKKKDCGKSAMCKYVKRSYI